MSFIDDMLNAKNIEKEANLIPQGENREDHFERKIEASSWISDTMALDPDKVEKEFLEAQAAEAKLLGKTAAYEQNESIEETLKHDYKKAVEILSDYALAEIVAGIRGHQEQNSSEMFNNHKEDAKKEIASNRKKVEEEVLKATGMSAQVDWAKAFARFTKEAKPEEPKEKDLYKSEVPEKVHDFEHPAEEKFKVPAEDKKADVMIGVGREADERTNVTQEAGVLKADITEGLSKVAEKVKDSPADDKDNIAMPEGKKSAGDKPVESVEESTLLPSPKEVGDKDDQAAEANSPEKGDKAKHEEAVNKEAHCGSCPGDLGHEQVNSPLKREELPVDKVAAESCPVCGIENESLGNLGQLDHYKCRDCGIMYSHNKEASCGHCGAMEEIKSCASKEEVIRKVAELNKVSEVKSPWAIIKDENGQDVIARIEQPKNEKISEEDKEDLKK